MPQCPYFKGGGYSGTDAYCDVDRKTISRTTIDNTCCSYGYDQCINYKKKASEGGCYLTTACMEVMQDVFDDDCAELTLLRRLRDNFVKINHPEVVEQYYRVAPQIVAAIDNIPERSEIYKVLYQEMILPAVAKIEAENYLDAYELYKEHSEALEYKYLTEDIDLTKG